MHIRFARVLVVGLIGWLAVSCATSSAPAVEYDLAKFGSGTSALQRALDACAAGGGGQVVVPPGRYVVGSVQMHSNTILRLSAGATLVGSPNADDYPLIPVRFEGETVQGHRGLIYAEDSQNIGIAGLGTLEGDSKLGDLRNPRGPCMVELVGCQNITLSDFTDTYRRMWSIHLLNCDNVTASHLKIRTTAPNSDGIDVDSTSHVKISDCDIDSGDDCVAIKSGRGMEAVQSYRPATDISISNCRMGSGFSAVGIGTEMSGGVADITISNCVITHGDCGVYIKANSRRGGYFRNIAAENITATKLNRFLGIDVLGKGIIGTEPVIGLAGFSEVSNVSFAHVKVSDCRILLDGAGVSAVRPVDGLTLSDFSGDCVRGIVLANVAHASLSGINVAASQGPLLAIRNVTGAGLENAAVAPPNIEELESSFIAPPDNARIQVRWWWFGPAVTHDELLREMQAMKSGGIGGFEVQPVYPLALDGSIPGLVNLKFLSPGFLDAINFVAAKAKELGLRMDLTMGSGWPYGGSMITLDDAAGRLRIARGPIDPGATQAPLPALRDAESLIAAFHTGDTEATYFIASHTGMKVKRPAYGAEGYVVDHLDPAAVGKFIQSVAEKEVAACGVNLPYSIFCDSLEVAGEDWTSNFLDEFKKRRGYDLRPLLPALIDDSSPKAKDIRRDWGMTLTELFNDYFVANMERFAQAHDTKFRLQAYGSPSAAEFSYANVDLPEGEGWQWHNYRQTRYATSSCHLMGDPVASSETFTWIHSPTFRATPLDIKAEADLHFLQGVNQIVCHGWPYTAAGVADPGWSFYAAGVFDDKNPWFIVMPDLARYLQRVSFMMRQGTPANDVLLYLSNNDAWANFTLGHISLTDGVGVCLGPKIVGKILDSGRNLDFFDDELLALRGKVEGGEIRFGDLRYNIVVLAGVERMPVATLQRLEEFARGGGVVVATRRLPNIAPGYLASDDDQKTVHDIVNRLFQAPGAPGIYVENEDQLADALNKRLAPDVEFSPPSPEIGVVHRHTEYGEVYFLANTSNHPVHVHGAFRVSQEHAEFWNPLTAEVAAATIVGPSTVTVDLAPYGSTILVWDDRRLRGRPAGGAVVNTDLADGWSVCFGGPEGFMPMDNLHSWTDDDATRHFSGVAIYRRNVHVSVQTLRSSQSIWLDFGTPTAAAATSTRRMNSFSTALDAPVREAAVVYVNGKPAGSVFSAPYSIDITAYLQPGDNDIRVNVANTALNELAAKGFPNYDYRAVVSKYGDRFEPQDAQDVRPIESGLVGKTQLIAIPRAAMQ